MALTPSQTGKTLYITLGNDLRGDDGAGPLIAGRLPSAFAQCVVLNAGERPENIIEDALASHPDKIVILDAADFSGVPGEIRVIPPEAIPDTTYSTHLFPIKAVVQMLLQDTDATVRYIGIQPGNVQLGAPISEPVLHSAEAIAAFIRRTP